MKSKIDFITDETKRVFSEINYKDVINGMIGFNGDLSDDRTGIFNIYQIIEFAFIEYHLKFSKTNVIYVAHILFKQLRENGELIEHKQSEYLTSKQKELCPQFSGKIYSKVRIYDDFSEIRNLNDYHRNKRLENEKRFANNLEMA